MNRILVIFSLLTTAPSGLVVAQVATLEFDSQTFTYSEKKVNSYYHFFLEGPTTHKFVSKHKVKNPKIKKAFDFLEGDLQAKYVQREAAFIIKQSGDTLASIVLRQDWFDIIMPDGRLYKFKRIDKYQWEYSLNGVKVFDAKLALTKDKKEISWKSAEVEPEAALALANVGAAYSWSAVHKGMSKQAVWVAVGVGVILALMRNATM